MHSQEGMSSHSTDKERKDLIHYFSGMQQSFGLPCSSLDKHAVDIGFLDHYATTQWEAILHYMVGTSLTKKPSRGVLNLLERSKLMQSRYGKKIQAHSTFMYSPFLL